MDSNSLRTEGLVEAAKKQKVHFYRKRKCIHVCRHLLHNTCACLLLAKNFVLTVINKNNRQLDGCLEFVALGARFG